MMWTASDLVLLKVDYIRTGLTCCGLTQTWLYIFWMWSGWQTSTCWLMSSARKWLLSSGLRLTGSGATYSSCTRARLRGARNSACMAPGLAGTGSHQSPPLAGDLLACSVLPKRLGFQSLVSFILELPGRICFAVGRGGVTESVSGRKCRDPSDSSSFLLLVNGGSQRFLFQQTCCFIYFNI